MKIAVGVKQNGTKKGNEKPSRLDRSPTKNVSKIGSPSRKRFKSVPNQSPNRLFKTPMAMKTRPKSKPSSPLAPAAIGLPEPKIATKNAGKLIVKSWIPA